jgi:hypothetical protein
MVSNESNLRKKEVTMKRIYYRELRKLMADYALDKSDIAKIIGKTPRQTSRILHRELSPKTGKPYIFDLCEAVNLVAYFRKRSLQDWENSNPGAKDIAREKAVKEINEAITIDRIFFDEVLSSESISA